MSFFTEERLERYSRHIILKEVGVQGQERLHAARVLIIGAVAGAPPRSYLAAAGVGTLGIADADRVDLSNLQRQVIHHTPDLGKAKVESAAEKMRAINPDVTVHTYREFVAAANIGSLVAGYDFVIDGTDNFAAKFLINDACVLAGIPFSHGGILRFQGQTMTVLPHKSACYRCIFEGRPPKTPFPPARKRAFWCHRRNVGHHPAAEGAEVHRRAGHVLADSLLTFDAPEMNFRKVPLRRQPACALCGDHPTITKLFDEEPAAACDLKGQAKPAARRSRRGMSWRRYYGRRSTRWLPRPAPDAAGGLRLSGREGRRFDGSVAAAKRGCLARAFPFRAGRTVCGPAATAGGRAADASGVSQPSGQPGAALGRGHPPGQRSKLVVRDRLASATGARRKSVCDSRRRGGGGTPGNRGGMTVSFYILPASLKAEIGEFEEQIRQFRQGQLEPTAFKARRVPFGIYEQRKDNTFMVRVRCPGGALTPRQTPHDRPTVADLCRRRVAHHHAAGVATSRRGPGEFPAILWPLFDAGLSSRRRRQHGAKHHRVGQCRRGPGRALRRRPLRFRLDQPADRRSRFLAAAAKVQDRLLEHRAGHCPGHDERSGVHRLGAERRPRLRGLRGRRPGRQGQIGHLLHEFVPDTEVYQIAEAIKRLFHKHGNREPLRRPLAFLWNSLGEKQFVHLYQQELEQLSASRPSRYASRRCRACRIRTKEKQPGHRRPTSSTAPAFCRRTEADRTVHRPGSRFARQPVEPGGAGAGRFSASAGRRRAPRDDRAKPAAAEYSARHASGGL